MSDLDQLGRRMAALQDHQLSALQESVAPVSSALGEHLLRRSRERRRNRRVALSSTAFVILAAGAITGWRVWPARDRGTVATVRAQAGQRVEASLLDVVLAFDDGSRVVLSSGASARTEMIGPASASVELERGRVNVHVLHTKNTHWTVRAGGYVIAVTGTRFRVDWRPEDGAFSVMVEEGSVRVSGGLLAEAVDIGTGQSLALEHGQALGAPAALPGSTALNPQTSASLAPQVVDRAPETAPAVAEIEPPSPSHRVSPRHVPAPSWRDQAEAGRYREALAEAERRGFDGICREAVGSDLLTLAEAARYAGRSDRAEQALKAIRARFVRGEDAATAAYLLGRIAAEGRRDHAEAARWFRTYLAERPSGRLNREAEGRLLESLAFMDRNTARDAARAYLEHYPSGPHAAFARNLLGP